MLLVDLPLFGEPNTTSWYSVRENAAAEIGHNTVPRLSLKMDVASFSSCRLFPCSSLFLTCLLNNKFLHLFLKPLLNCVLKELCKLLIIYVHCFNIYSILKCIVAVLLSNLIICSQHNKLLRMAFCVKLKKMLACFLMVQVFLD